MTTEFRKHGCLSVSTRIAPVSGAFQFAHRVEFWPGEAEEILRDVPAAPGVFALRGARDGDEPYLMRAADLRRRLRRLLAPPEALDEQGRPVLSKRLNLRDRVRWIEWTRTGSEFESVLVLYCASLQAFGEERARKRMRLYPPYCVRVTIAHQHPRVYVTNRLSSRSVQESFGPFPSRAAAERYADAALDLFRLRRCHEDLQVHAEHPGCVYGEMGKCMAPCKTACTADEYVAEARAMLRFFQTGGESVLAEIAAKREAASEDMDFEAAASLHKQWERVKAATQLADEIVRPIADVRALIVQESAPGDDGEKQEEAALFLLERGRIVGPDRLSTLGVRAVREQTAVGSSLFAQPLMLAAVPEEQGNGEQGVGIREQERSGGSTPTSQTRDVGHPSFAQVGLSPEERAQAVVARLGTRAGAAGEPSSAELSDALALFRRWYYRPAKQRGGEVILPNADGSWPVRRLLNAAARVALGPPKESDAVDREAAKALKTRVLHEGRPDVERVVPVLPKRARTRKSVTPADVV